MEESSSINKSDSNFRSSPSRGSDSKSKNVLRQRASQIKMINMDKQRKEEERLHLLTDEDGIQMRRRGSAGIFTAPKSKDDFSDEETESLIVIEFSESINRVTLHWIVDKIRGSKIYGGADLLLKREPCRDPSDGLTIHISATKFKLLELADDLGIMKQTKNGLMRNFNIISLDDFFLNDTMDVEDILTKADRQVLVKYALDTIRASATERCFPGTEMIQLYYGESIIQAAYSSGLITNIYSLHDKEFLKELSTDWYKSKTKQPIDRIREYFGESIGIYFGFVGFYTVALVIPTVLGILQYTLSYESVLFFCIFNVVWMTVFTEIWKRRCSALAYKWGTISMTNLDLPRLGYYGKIGKDPVTGKMTPLYPLYKTYIKMYFITYPVILLFLTGASIMTLSQFWIEDSLRESFGPDSLIVYIPSVVVSIVVALLSVFYEYLATWLSDFENHRTEIQYEKHRVVKLIILEFVNNFLSLFYIAFVLRDIKQLRSQLMTQLIIVQAIQNVNETLYPFFKQKLFKFSDNLTRKKSTNDLESKKDRYEELNLAVLDDDDPLIEQTHSERDLEEYNSTYEDYLELYIQFGYVVLFSSVAPLAAFWAFVNNVIEIRVDAFKLCKMYKRPFAKRAKDSGAWLLSFQILSLMSIVTNCGIMLLLPQVKDLWSNLTEAQCIIVMALLEHGLFIAVWFINKMIPDCPHWIRVAMARADYESRQALKRENAQNSKKLLFRRFRSVYGKSGGD